MFEWWEFKLSPLLTIFYATALFCGASLIEIWILPLYLLFSLGVGAIYVSVINDLTDIETDELAGKNNRFADKSLLFKSSILSICLVLGLILNFFWFRFNFYVGLFYLAAWISYTLYSVPPFRFKNRGLLGILCDATGAHFFPFLFVTAATFAWIGKDFDIKWLILIGIWSFSSGIRGILWHQLQDFFIDRKSGVNTFVTKYSRSIACLIGERIIFPIEIISFVILILYSQNFLVTVFLLFYFLLIWSRSVVWEMNVVIVAPQPQYQIVMDDFYSALFPLSVLLPLIVINPANLIIAGVHFVLFPKTLISFFRDTLFVIKDAIKQNRNHLYPFE